jgi:hypothetical protein
MKNLAAALVLAALILPATPAGADPGWVTDWEFIVSYANKQETKDSDAKRTGDVLMPAGIPWVCSRVALTTDNAGATAGFVCNPTEVKQNAGAFIVATCPVASEAVDRSSVIIAGPDRQKHFVVFWVNCYTHRKK